MRRRAFLRTAGSGVAVATGAAAMPGSAAAAADGETHTVEMTDGLAFEPDSPTVAPGDTVVAIGSGAGVKWPDKTAAAVGTAAGIEPTVDALREAVEVPIGDAGTRE
jgi:hypothetical protein